MEWKEPKFQNEERSGGGKTRFTPLSTADSDKAKMMIVENFSEKIVEMVASLKMEDRNAFCLAIGMMPIMMARAFVTRMAKKGSEDSATFGLAAMSIIECLNYMEQCYDNASLSEREEIRGICATHNQLKDSQFGHFAQFGFDIDSMADDISDRRKADRKLAASSSGSSITKELLESQPPEIVEAMRATATMDIEEWTKKYGHLTNRIAEAIRKLAKKKLGK